jgi:hypothetical protein
MVVAVIGALLLGGIAVLQMALAVVCVALASLTALFARSRSARRRQERLRG